MAEPAAPRTLVLVRHGRTAWNHQGRVQGQEDVGLDATGLAQAARTAPVIAALRPTLLWSSDLDRARTTAAPLGAAAGLTVTLDARLREFHFGEREGLTHAEFAELDPEGFHALRRGDYDRVVGAEPTVVVQKRMAEAIGELLAALGPGETGVAVSHGGAIRVATATLLDWPDGMFHTLRGLDNCGWVVLQEHPETGALTLRAYNRTAD